MHIQSFTVHSPLSSDPILRTPLSKWDSDVLRYSPDRDIIALHSPILFDSDDTDDLEFGQQQIPASNRRSKRYTPTHQLTDSGIAIPSTGPNRHSGSQRGRAAATAVNGTGRSGADSRHRRQSGSMLRPGDSKINGTKPVTGQTTLSERSEHTSESADQTSSSLITSSTHPSTGIADDSGLGESIKPLQSTKSCQDLVSLNVSLHALHFPRSQSWPELHLLNLSDAAYHDEDDVAHEDQATNGDLLLHQCTIVTRTRSCGALSKDLTDSVLDVPIRRINSLPNWSVMDRGDDGDATQPQFDDHNQPVVENIKQERNTAKHETVEPVSS
ncbi:hypothetical protein D915_006031 [Fasciola hepatica]|uniref:Uncharacterized protein n=1 Tax=Fasciola hepatica TaxID=6192 RepID=A0A2H1C9T4_FASHE|nr:hypothetical protein D915_006031 [Fasciola hepatica]